MKLFYHHDPIGNFGDDLNAWLWPRLIPDLLDDDDSTLFVGIGSILDERIPDEPRKVVFGTGIGYGRLPAIDERWQICCVRGPLSARALGLPHDLAITDPAALVSTLPPEGTAERHDVSFIPHHRTKIRAAEDGLDLRGACERAGIYYIDPADEAGQVIAALRNSEVVIAEAMHGAIVADALRVPWIPVRLYDHILDLKWRDWCSSLGMGYRPTGFPGYQGTLDRFLAGMWHTGTRNLSGEADLNRVVRRLQERLAALRADRSQDCCVTGGPQFAPDPEVIRSVPWLYDIQLALLELGDVVRPGERFILVDEGKWGGGKLLAGREAIPFLEKDGVYWGLPPDDQTAIRELERLRWKRASCIVFGRDSRWWLDYYSDFASYLRSNYPVILESERVLVFGLLPDPSQ